MFVPLTLVSSLCGLLVGCDEEVRDTVVSGLQSGATEIVTALMTALFQSFMNDDSTTTMLNVVQQVMSVIF